MTLSVLRDELSPPPNSSDCKAPLPKNPIARQNATGTIRNRQPLGTLPSYMAGPHARNARMPLKQRKKVKRTGIRKTIDSDDVETLHKKSDKENVLMTSSLISCKNPKPLSTIETKASRAVDFNMPYTKSGEANSGSYQTASMRVALAPKAPLQTNKNSMTTQDNGSTFGHSQAKSYQNKAFMSKYSDDLKMPQIESDKDNIGLGHAFGTLLTLNKRKTMSAEITKTKDSNSLETLHKGLEKVKEECQCSGTQPQPQSERKRSFSQMDAYEPMRKYLKISGSDVFSTEDEDYKHFTKYD